MRAATPSGGIDFESENGPDAAFGKLPTDLLLGAPDWFSISMDYNIADLCLACRGNVIFASVLAVLDSKIY